MGVPLYVICHFSLVAFNILSLTLIFVGLITVCLCVPPWVYPSWDSVLLGLDYFLSYLQEIVQLLSLQTFSQVLSLSLLLLGPL